MDALALLCNLHADGPLTLQRLRRLGCESIEAILDLEPAALERELNQEPSSAERFKREARSLMERLQGGDVLTSRATDESSGSPASASQAENRSVEEREVTLQPAAREVLPEVREVLDAWRALDEDELPHAGPLAPSPEAYSESPSDLSLEGLEIDGLTEEVVELLEAFGVHSLQGLVSEDSLELSRELPLPWTRVKRLQFLARRELASLPDEVPQSADADGSSEQAPEEASEEPVRKNASEIPPIPQALVGASVHAYDVPLLLRGSPGASGKEVEAGAPTSEGVEPAEASSAEQADAVELGIEFPPPPAKSRPTIQDILGGSAAAQPRATRGTPASSAFLSMEPLGTQGRGGQTDRRKPAEEVPSGADEEAGSSGPFA